MPGGTPVGGPAGLAGGEMPAGHMRDAPAADAQATGAAADTPAGLTIQGEWRLTLSSLSIGRVR
ncbi:hypothetical protein [Roseisolibacter sp. H3M3-2]|uniref:hypothetical protein n=1 Tax=Roseisolibacter sp. H3M3-2 TaxID=3031323 RepID=UPI0023DB7E53|nr:hypothetical protein [Roseisolibacter sp. H3M3-2]MDF1505123.1 hypothetical protein [Roseisolibacter sp. H3M3-2]